MFAPALFGVLVCWVGSLYFINSGKLSTEQSISICKAATLAIIGPVLLLFIDYVLINYPLTTKVDQDSIEVTTNTLLQVGRLGDIKRVIIYLTPALYVKSNIYQYPLDGCFVVKIEFVDRPTLYLTNLMLPSPELPFLNEVPKETKKLLFPFICLIRNSLAF